MSANKGVKAFKVNASSDIHCTRNNYFGTALKEIRLEKGLTQIEAANLLNTTQAQWSSYENGRNRPSLEMILQISKAFELHPYELFKRSLKKSEIFKEFFENPDSDEEYSLFDNSVIQTKEFVN